MDLDSWMKDKLVEARALFPETDFYLIAVQAVDADEMETVAATNIPSHMRLNFLTRYSEGVKMSEDGGEMIKAH